MIRAFWAKRFDVEHCKQLYNEWMWPQSPSWCGPLSSVGNVPCWHFIDPCLDDQKPQRKSLFVYDALCSPTPECLSAHTLTSAVSPTIVSFTTVKGFLHHRLLSETRGFLGFSFLLCFKCLSSYYSAVKSPLWTVAPIADTPSNTRRIRLPLIFHEESRSQSPPPMTLPFILFF